MRSLCRALLVLNVLYCVLAAAQEGLPGWHMFESVETIDHELRDRDGRLVDVREWLPRGANVVDRAELRRIVSFVCVKERAGGPFTYREWRSGSRGQAGEAARDDARARDAVAVTLGDDCKVHAAR